MEDGAPSISAEVLGAYAADAACEVAGVTGMAEGARHRHRGVRVTGGGDELALELHVTAEWGASIPELGAAVQHRVAGYLQRMAGVSPAAIDVVVDGISPPPPQT